jgi:hypothetical protein
LFAKAQIDEALILPAFGFHSCKYERLKDVVAVFAAQDLFEHFLRNHVFFLFWLSSLKLRRVDALTA